MRSRRTKKNGGQEAQALGRSRGGFSTKIHVVVDGLGNPIRIVLTGGHRHDISQAEALLSDCMGDNVIADRGYDFDDFISFIVEHDAVPVIPSRKNRKEQREYDKHLWFSEVLCGEVVKSAKNKRWQKVLKQL